MTRKFDGFMCLNDGCEHCQCFPTRRQPKKKVLKGTRIGVSFYPPQGYQLDRKIYLGGVVGWNDRNNVWDIEYDDGERNQFTEEEELKAATATFQNYVMHKNIIIGTKVAKVFNGRLYQGEIVDFNNDNGCWNVLYEDDNREAYDNVEAKQIIQMYYLSYPY
jgi:hypothetical protein